MPSDPYEQPSLKKRFAQGAVVFLLILAAVLAKPGYQRVKVWRSRQLAKQALELAQNHQFAKSMERVQAALQLAPNDRGNYRVIATTLSLASRPEALRFWQALISSPDATPDDRVELILSALLGNRLDIARKQIDVALKDSPSNGKVLRAAALYCELNGDHVRAIQFARAYLGRDPESEEMQFFLAREMVQTEQERMEGKNVLFRIAENNGKFSLDALQALEGLPSLGETELKRCLALAVARGNAKLASALLEANFKIRLDPSSQTQIVSNLIERFGEAKGEELLDLARWLNRKLFFTQLVSLLSSREITFANQDFLLIYLDALAALRRWAIVGDVLDREKVPLSSTVVELFRARVARELGDNQGAESHWDRVNALANDDPSVLPYVAEYAEKSGERDRARQAYKRLTAQPDHARPAYAALIRLAEQEGDTAGLEHILQEMVELYPDDPTIKNDLAYIQLLENRKVSESLETSRKFLRETPGSVSYRVAAALGLLKVGDVRGAKALFDEAPLTWDTALPGWQAVYVAILGSLGQTHTAAALAEQIPFGRLKPEERELIAPWRKGKNDHVGPSE